MMVSRRLLHSSKKLLSEHQPAVLRKFDVLSSSLPPSTLTIKSVGNHGITAGNTRVKGPAIILHDALLLWDVPQFGVGGPALSENPPATESGAANVNDPASPFHGWSSNVFKIFDLVEPKPGTPSIFDFIRETISKALHLMTTLNQKYWSLALDIKRTCFHPASKRTCTSSVFKSRSWTRGMQAQLTMCFCKKIEDLLLLFYQEFRHLLEQDEFWWT
jgi:hypothetical protein